MHHVVDRRGEAELGREPDAEDHVADVAHQGERQQSLDVGLGERAEDAHEHGEPADDEQQRRDVAALEDDGLGADDRVDATFVSRPANTAVTGAGAVGYESGSQKDSGKTAALMPKARRSSRCRMSCTLSGSSAMRTESCAMFAVPVAP